MSRLRYLGLAAVVPCLAVLLPQPPSTAAKEGLAVKLERNVEYTTAGGEKLMLDIAVPTEGGPYPCVVCMHGGAWRMGDRRDLSTPDRGSDGKTAVSPIEMIASHGYVAASISYRLAPKHKFPAQIEDAKTAVRYLRSNAKKYRIDRDKFASLGFSAGGHLALLLGLTDKSAGLEGTDYSDESSRVQCVVDFFGPADLSLYAASSGLEDGYMVPFLGKECKTDAAVYKKASPIEYVSKDDPPVLLIHGTIDIVVPIIHSERLLKKLQDAGVTAELLTVRGEGHGWNGKALTKTNEAALAFLDAHLKGKK